jgi:hypothetical protein
MMKQAFAFAFAVTLSVAGEARSEQYKEMPIKSYVLTDPDGTPRYLVQYSEESNFRTVYYVKPVKSDKPVDPATSSPPQRAESYRRPTPEKRFIWPNEWM